MEFFDVVAERRSIRSFNGNQVPGELLEKCLNAARMAPSGSNAQPWRFLMIRSPERLAALAEAGFGQPCLGTAPVVAVLLGDRGVYKKRLRRAKELADMGAVNSETVEIIEKRYKAAKESRDVHDKAIALNCMLAGEHYVMAAAAQGLGCCWVMLFDADKVSAALGLEKDNFPVALLPTGYYDALPLPRPRYGLQEMAWDEEVNRPWSETRSGE